MIHKISSGYLHLAVMLIKAFVLRQITDFDDSVRGFFDGDSSSSERNPGL